MEETLRFALVGPGRAGTALTEALTRAGWTLTAVAGREPAAPSTVTAAHRFDVPARAHADVAEDAEVLLVATPDACIAEVAQAVAPGLRSDALVVHLAGSLGLEAFTDLAAIRGDVRLGACHPLMTLSGTPGDADRLGRAWFAVEGHPMTEMIVEALGGRAFSVDDRRRYHAAASVASNHLVALMGQVERLAADAGVPAAAFVPLIEATVANVNASVDAEGRGVAGALTGPVARGDVGTLRSHLQAIADDERPAYRALALEALRLADLPAEREHAVRAVLRAPERPADSHDAERVELADRHEEVSTP